MRKYRVRVKTAGSPIPVATTSAVRRYVVFGPKTCADPAHDWVQSENDSRRSTSRSAASTAACSSQQTRYSRVQQGTAVIGRGAAGSSGTRSPATEPGLGPSAGPADPGAEARATSGICQAHGEQSVPDSAAMTNHSMPSASNSTGRPARPETAADPSIRSVPSGRPQAWTVHSPRLSTAAEARTAGPGRARTRIVPGGRARHRSASPPEPKAGSAATSRNRFARPRRDSWVDTNGYRVRSGRASSRRRCRRGRRGDRRGRTGPRRRTARACGWWCGPRRRTACAPTPPASWCSGRHPPRPARGPAPRGRRPGARRPTRHPPARTRRPQSGARGSVRSGRSAPPGRRRPAVQAR